MEKKKCLTFLFCLILCYSLFQHIARAQSSSQTSTSIFSQGSITYAPSNVNLAVIPNDWGVYDNDPSSWTTIVRLDYNVTHDGDLSIRIGPHTSADTDITRECDGTWYNVKPGDHILVKVWAKTAASGLNPDPSQYAGGRIGMDYYGSTSAGYGILYESSAVDTQMGVPGWYDNSTGSIGAGWRIPYNQDWTLIGWDVTIPSTVCSYVNVGGTIESCTPHQVDSFVVWLDARSQNNPAFVWFADAELYINPT